MSSKNLAKAAILMVVIVLAVLISWELTLRNRKVSVSYDEGGALWAYVRGKVYDANSTIFIGSSRIKYDLDAEGWENTTGDHAVILACQGSSPLPVLDNLAADEKFKGRLIIDVTEGLFFSNAANAADVPNKGIEYYKDMTPAKRASFELNKMVESNIRFLDDKNYSINARLDQMMLKNRPGVFRPPVFPEGFSETQLSRQNKMTTTFLADTSLQNQVKGIWAAMRAMNRRPPPNGPVLDSIVNSVKMATDRIKARGGQILFVRTPASGPMWAGEQAAFPREKFWDRVLEATGSPGIHFADYVSTDHFQCPEFSHLSPSDATIYTQELIKILLLEKGWKFPKLP